MLRFLACALCVHGVAGLVLRPESDRRSGFDPLARWQDWKQEHPGVDGRDELLACLSNTTVPLIILSEGRSGSTAIADIVGNLLNLHSDFTEEIPGMNAKEQEDFFSDEHAFDYLVTYLCNAHRAHPEDKFVGFKWKPRFFEGQFARAWKGITSFPGAKVIYSTRNMLDVLVSGDKHEQNKELPAHCVKGDTSCIEDHSNAVEMDLTHLMDRLRDREAMRNHIEGYLSKLDEPCPTFTMEGLLQEPSMVPSWTRLLAYLGEPHIHVTEGLIEAATHLTSTRTVTQFEQMKNFAEVEKLLRHSKYSALLHPYT